jgi:Peptidase family M41
VPPLPFRPKGAGVASPRTQWLIDEEVQRVVDDAHAEVMRLLAEHRKQLDGFADALLDAETLDAPDAPTDFGRVCVDVHAASTARSNASASSSETACWRLS